MQNKFYTAVIRPHGAIAVGGCRLSYNDSTFSNVISNGAILKQKVQGSALALSHLLFALFLIIFYLFRISFLSLCDCRLLV